MGIFKNKMKINQINT